MALTQPLHLFASPSRLLGLVFCLTACSSGASSSNRQAGGGAASDAGASGVSGAGISNTGTAGMPSAGASAGNSGALGDSGGARAVGGSGASSFGGSSASGASGNLAGDGGGGASTGGASGSAGGSTVPANFFMRYEAESPVNTLTYPVEGLGTEGDTACPTDGVKEGANCASGGRVVNQILGRSPCTPPTSTTSYDQCQNKGGGVQFNEVTVPVAGTYDVTFWYHCGPDKPGHADVYGDTKCGGLNYDTGAGSGCRPHLIDVNGVPMSTVVAGKTAPYYQFPCYPAPWSVLHGATTALPLKAGPNTVYIHAPGATTLDAADLDALDVQPEGRGTAPAPLWPKLVTPVVTGN